ncbi:type IV pilin protein [Actinokineospora sp.]|uniref:type IV pilin protein n=1 Tax=Actinokineospora sp. TaxID=1872133 RepID=UPI003D6C346A
MSQTGARKRARSAEGGFTLIEIFVVLAVLGLLISLAVPRYLGTRRHAFVTEADHVLQELRTIAWAYYVQYGTWAGLTSANMPATFSFTPPDDADGCWDYGLATDGTTARLELLATGDSTPAKCGPVNTGIVTLTLNGDGSATQSESLP